MEHINYGDNEINIDYTKVEQRRGAKYIGCFAIKSGGGWTDLPVQVYWQEKPPVEGYSNYFGIFTRAGGVFICSAGSLEGVEFAAIRCGDEIFYSRYRHDYRGGKNSKGEQCAIDGGRDYTRYIGDADEYLTLKLEGPKLVVVNRNHG